MVCNDCADATGSATSAALSKFYSYLNTLGNYNYETVRFCDSRSTGGADAVYLNSPVFCSRIAVHFCYCFVEMSTLGEEATQKLFGQHFGPSWDAEHCFVGVKKIKERAHPAVAGAIEIVHAYVSGAASKATSPHQKSSGTASDAQELKIQRMAVLAMWAIFQKGSDVRSCLSPPLCSPFTGPPLHRDCADLCVPRLIMAKGTSIPRGVLPCAPLLPSEISRRRCIL
jgi:hypothetical protein